MQFNLLDLIILVILGYFVWSGYQQGLLLGILNLVRTAAALFLSLTLYPQWGDVLIGRFGLSKVVGQVVGFVIILILVEVILGFIISKFHKVIFNTLFKIKPLFVLDKVLGIVPSVIIGLILITTFTLLPLILPIGNGFKDPVQQSWWGRNVIPQAVAYEPLLESFIYKLPTRNLIYMVTRNPESDETIAIDKPDKSQLKISPEDEDKMLTLLNLERVKVGLKPVVMDPQLLEVARKHSRDMFERGYFSHYTPEGKNPFQRMDEDKVQYQAAGENLAFAPTVEIAHQGLMNSKGHRENMLNQNFGKVGIGVIDGGFYGRMFSQEFAD